MDKNNKVPKTATTSKENVKKCCIGTCTRWKKEAKFLHQIPNHDALIQIRWFSFIRKSRGPNWTPADDNNVPLVCSLHFQDRNYFFSKAKQKTLLKSTACPIFQEPRKRRGRNAAASNTTRLDEKAKHHSSTESTLNRQSDDESDDDVVITMKDVSSKSQSSSSSHRIVSSTEGPIISKTSSGGINNMKNNNTAESGETTTDLTSQGDLNKTTTMTSLKPILAARPTTTTLSPLTAMFPNSVPFRPLPIYIVPSTAHPVQLQATCPAPSIHQTVKNSTNIENSSPSFVQTIHSQNSQNTVIKNVELLNYRPKKYIPPSIRFCLLCNKNLDVDNNIEEHIQESEQIKAREILLNTLNIQAGDLEMTDNHPICCQCHYKVLDLQACIDKFTEQQREMEKQRNDLLRDIVKTYCERISRNSKGCAKFFNSSAVHELLVQKWASTIRPPFLATDPPCSKNIDTSFRNLMTAFRGERADQNRVRRREKKKAYYEERERLKLEKASRKLQGGRRKRKPTMEDSLENNAETLAGGKRYTCQICSKTFLREANLRTHQLCHGVGDLKFGRTDRLYQCKYCEKQIRHGTAFFHHITSHFGNEIVTDTETIFFYHCDDEGCTISLSDLSEFHAHLLTHSEVPLECSSCSKRFASAKYLELHQKVHSESEAVFYDCPYCHEAFETENALNSHSNSHEFYIDLGAFNVKCNHCDEKFACELHCQQHCQSKHRGLNSSLGSKKRKYPQFLCETCGTEFNTESRLRMHNYEHTHPDGFPCESCHQIFPNPTKLCRHKKKQTCQKTSQNATGQSGARSKRRQKVKILLCKHCPFTSRSTYLFRRHLLLTHPESYVNGKQFFCNVCWKNYATEELLTEHQKISHSRYICPTCNRIFGNIVRLRLHERIHSGIKPYLCQYCHKRFNLEPNLKEHENRHTGARPYKCPICNAGFLRKKQMMQHIEKLHRSGEEPE